MTERTTLGADLRRERESRGLALKSISEDTKVSLALLEGLEADDISRWPGGIFRRAFVRAYAQCVGLDADDVFRRFEKQFPPEGAEPTQAVDPRGPNTWPVAMRPLPAVPQRPGCTHSLRTRALGTAADLTVALASSAAATRIGIAALVRDTWRAG